MRVWMVAALLLAGCAGKAPAEEPDAFQGLEATDKTGVIRGVVVDQSIRPVPGATVVASPGGLETLTDEIGAFGFADLVPGVYFLTVSAPYHTTVQTSTEVEAGQAKPPVVRVVIEALPKPLPAIQALEWRFFMDSSVWAGGVGGVVLGNTLGEGTFTATLEIDGNASWIQSELVWEAAQPLASDVMMDNRLLAPGDDSIESDRSLGTSPIVHAFTDANQTMRADRVGYTLFVRDGTYPVGVTFAQELSLYLHVFQHFTPEAGWQFGRDGPHTVPPPP